MRAPGCSVCGCPRIPWPGREGLFCVHGHGIRRPIEPQPEPLQQFGYHFGIDLSQLGRVA